MKHDIDYGNTTTLEEKHEADREMLYNLSLIQNPTLSEKVDRFIVKKMISAKLKLGLGNSKKKKKLIGSHEIIKIEEQLADELNKPIITKFLGRKVYSKEVDYIWSTDLIEINNDKAYKYTMM